MGGGQNEVSAAGKAPACAPACATPRNPGIDLLRGISIVLVVMHHMALRLPLDKSPVASAPTIEAEHSGLVRILMGGFRLSAIKVGSATSTAF